MNNLYYIIQILLMIIFAPLISGIITKIKNTLRFRTGPSPLQPYYNLAKYFSKDEVVAASASWIFRATPYIVLSSTVVAIMLLPLSTTPPQLAALGDFLVIIFLLSLGRFFLTLAGLDPATCFGGMGASREMFISSFIEPVTLLAVFAVSLVARSTSLTIIASAGTMTTATIMAATALFLVTLAETSRVPVDNQETHLELTMIHEAMLLEYSGRSLGLLELAAYLKQWLLFSILSLIILPSLVGLGYFILKILAITLIVALTELSLAKMRLFRVVDFLSFAGILSMLAIIALILGV